MKKIFLPLGLLALIAAPSAGSAKLVLDMPPILAATGGCDAACNPCEPATCKDGKPCGCCGDGVCNPCTAGADFSNCVKPCVSCCPAATCDPCSSGTYTPAACPNSCKTSCCNSTCDPCSTSCTTPCTSCVRFNDTGITAPTGGGQDADFGRDKTHPDDVDGHAGFSFTKITNGGKTCIKDNVTGLTWSPDLNITSNWDGTGEVVTANSNLCGKLGWRLPTLRELLSIVSYHKINPAIDNDATRGFFSDTQSAVYWTSDSIVSATKQWGVHFSTGGTSSLDQGLDFARVRLVTSN